MRGGGYGSWRVIRQGLMEDTSNVSLKRSWPYLKRLLPYLRPYVLPVTGGSVAVLLHTAAGVLRPFITMFIIDNVIPRGESGLRLLALLVGGWFALAVVENLLNLLQTYLFSYVNESIFNDLRTEMYDHIQRLPVTYFDGQQTGSLLSRITSDVAALSGVFGRTLTDFAINALQIIAIAAVMLVIHPTLALVGLVSAPFFAVSFLLFKDKMRTVQKRSQEKQAALSGALQERLSAVRLLKSFVREDREATFVRERSEELAGVQIRRAVTSSLGGVISGVFGVLGPLGVTWLGVVEIIRGRLTLGQFFAFSQWITRLLQPSRYLVMLMFGIQFSLGAAERVFEILDMPIEDNDGKKRQPAPPHTEGSVSFEQVQFSYTSEVPVLSGVTLSVPAGKRAALVGLSGSGKSTLAKLLMRLYPVSEGTIKIDGTNIDDIELPGLRNLIGYIDQDTVLFNDTVRENVRYGRQDADDEDILAAVRAANALEFVRDLPDGFETVIGERGVKLSGGQQQRISIARTFLKDPPILVLDEATSSLDSESESAIHAALDELMSGRTTLIISHRLSTLKKADVIFVLKDGRIVEEGTHLELIGKQGLYKRLFDLQVLESGGGAAKDERLTVDRLVRLRPRLSDALERFPGLREYLERDEELMRRIAADPASAREILRRFRNR